MSRRRLLRPPSRRLDVVHWVELRPQEDLAVPPGRYTLRLFGAGGTSREEQLDLAVVDEPRVVGGDVTDGPGSGAR